MVQYLVKLAITSVLVVAISEVSKRNALMGAVLASIPLVSVLAMIWLYADTRDVDKVASLATGIFWLVLPSLALFIALPVLLHRGVGFPLAMSLSIAVTVAAYFVMLVVLKKFGIEI
ncbi:MAG: DUF3147 family protein [Pseudomonadota bacterium]|nr:DUF3147 family protein [Pseudomonadota bacterium]